MVGDEISTIIQGNDLCGLTKKVVPDDSEGEWAGMPVCKGCYDEVEKRKHEICSCGDTVLPLSYQLMGSPDAFCHYCDKPICRREE
ncbi:MAG: hypothetical protein ACTSPB_00285 [Candidatus Thorarchaeota archaeon]